MKQLFGILLVLWAGCGAILAQSTGAAGTVTGNVLDQTGAAIPGATVTITNRISNFKRSAQTDATGTYRINGVPPNPYHAEATAPGFGVVQQDVTVRSAVPVTANFTLAVAAGETSVTVEGGTEDVLEDVPYQHNDVDRQLIAKLPVENPGAGLSAVITNSSPGIVSDANGMMHPLGEHADTSYVIDGQPISDQQSKNFSTQLPPNAIQSMEVVTGTPSAEYGDKTALVVNATTRSGLGQPNSMSLVGQYGSFGTAGEQFTMSNGSAKSKIGNFLLVNMTRSGRFLDSPEFHPFHDIGNNEAIFDRFDYQPSANDTFHLNMYGVRNWFQAPVTYDQIGQDQRQLARTFNFGAGWQHTVNPHAILTVTPFVRQDRVNYYPSADPFADTPATLAQDRHLTNWGVRADVSYVSGGNNLKIGTQLMQTRLAENFSLGITDPNLNPVCADQFGNATGASTLRNPGQCAGAGLSANPQFIPGLLAYDLSRGGSLLRFHASGNVNEYAVYAQDTWTIGNLTLTPGVRIDVYRGPASDQAVEPRMGASYQVKKTGTVLRASYTRAFETPYNENLLISTSTGAGGLSAGLGAYGANPLQPGRRNEYNAGFQQTLGKYLILDANYFWRFGTRAFDFDTLFNTPITFPIEWRQSKTDGLAARVSTTNIHGFQAYITMGHTRARFFGPEVGGLIFNSPVNYTVFRIDHDEAFEQSSTLRYQRGKDGPWMTFTWRYDSGMVAGSVTDLQDALSLTADQQAAIGFYCGGQRATLGAPITACAPNQTYGATRIHIPAPGTANPDTNPPRIAPRNVFDFGLGTDNLFHGEKYKTTVRFTVQNLSNVASLYNFLSTFSGTHWVTPRMYMAEVGFNF